jgi:hypothetical protein
MDLSRTYVVVDGRSADPRDKFVYSASDPKLLAFGGRLYLYWTAVKYWYPPGARKRELINITTRGMELEQERTGLRRVWGKGSAGPVASYDPARNIQVWGVEPGDPRSSQTVDMFSIVPIGGRIYATAGVGGSGCLVPEGQSSGCFRPVISVSDIPLGRDIFNHHVLPEELLPSNAQDYLRIFRKPDGSLFMIGNFRKPNPSAAAERAVTPGPQWLSFPMNALPR